MIKLKFLFLFLIFNSNLFSQIAPFPSPSLELGIIYNCNFFGQCDYYDQSIYFTNSDTILCGKTYQVFKSFQNQYYQIFTRQEDGKIYIGNCNYEQLLYDFDLNVGDIFQVTNPPLTLNVDSITQVTLLNGDSRQSIWLHNTNSPNDVRQWIEGLGDVNLGLTYTSDWEGGYEEFICAKDSTGLLWLANNNNNTFCDSLTCKISVPDFSYQNNNQVVTFDNVSIYAENWSWDFGDGSFSTEENPIHTYNSVGCYEVSLTTNNNCSEEKLICKKVSLDFESPWTEINLVDSLNAGRSSFLTPEIGWMSSNNSLFKTINAGVNWEEQILPHPSPYAHHLSSFAFLNESIGIVVAWYSNGPNFIDPKLFKTIDGGLTWEEHHPTTASTLLNTGILNENFMWTTAQYRDFIVSSDGGNTWTEKNIQTSFPSEFKDFHAITEDTIFAIGHIVDFAQPPLVPWTTLIAKTYDGENWEVFDFPDIPLLYDLFFLNADEGWIVGQEGTIAHTTDGGVSWEIQYSNPKFSFYNIVFLDDLTGWVVGSGGRILHTIDGGQNWIPQLCEDTKGFYSISFPTSEVGFASGQGEFYKYCALPSCETSSIFENPKSVASLSFQPNPFNDFTFLKFDNPNNESHQFVLTDISGRVLLEIKNLSLIHI